MRVQLLARPDHSVFLYRELESQGVDVSYYTFHAFREGSLANWLLPNRKTVPAPARTATLFTLLDYPVARFGQRFGLNTRPAETWLAERTLRPPGLATTDLVHYWPFYFAPLVRRLMRERDIATLADYYEAEPSFANALYREAYRRAGLPFERPYNELIDQNEAFSFERNFVVPSRLTADSYRKRFRDSVIHVVPYGLMGKQIVGQPPPRPRRRWVFVGRVCLEKGIDILLTAMRQLTDCTLDLIGGVPASQDRYLRERAKGLSGVRFLGHMANVDVLARLPEYDAFVMPSLCDSYSIATIEAVCAGLPVVVTDNCGVESAVREHGLGATCATGDADALAAAMRMVSDELREDALREAHRRFESAEHAAPYATRMLQLYRSLTTA